MEKKRPVSHPEKIIRLKTVLLRTGLSRSTLYRKIADGTFPRQLPISINGAGWHESPSIVGLPIRAAIVPMMQDGRTHDCAPYARSDLRSRQ